MPYPSRWHLLAQDVYKRYHELCGCYPKPQTGHAQSAGRSPFLVSQIPYDSSLGQNSSPSTKLGYPACYPSCPHEGQQENWWTMRLYHPRQADERFWNTGQKWCPHTATKEQVFAALPMGCLSATKPTSGIHGRYHHIVALVLHSPLAEPSHMIRGTSPEPPNILTNMAYTVYW